MSDAGCELRKLETNLVELKEKIYDEIKETVSDVHVTFRKTQFIFILNV